MRRLWMCVVVATWLLLAPPARADVYDDNPAAATVSGTVYVFARNAADNQIIERHRVGDTWTAWAPVPGLVAGSGPAAMAYGSELWLFVRGQDGAAWWNRLVNGRWSGWEWLDGQLTSAPAAGLRFGTSKAELVVRGTNNELWLRTFTPEQGWTYWASFPGSVGSAPTVTGYHQSGSIDVFVRDAAVGDVIQRYGLGDGSWSDWFNYDGDAVGAPASTFARFNRLDLYYRGTTGWLYYREHPAGTGSWTLLDTTKLDSSPAATSDYYGHELIFARIGNDLHVKEATVPDTNAGLPTFGSWVSLGPIGLPQQQQQQPTTGPSTVVVQPPRPERLTPAISYQYDATTRRTTFSKLVIRDVPAGATVRVTCARGCSAKRLSVTLRTARVVSLRKFIRRPIPVGRKLVVTVTKPGMIGSHKVLTMRPKDEPRITTRCLPPGTTRPQAC